jgi:hypothetical protein
VNLERLGADKIMNPRKMFKKVFNSGKSDTNQIKTVIKGFIEPEMNMDIGNTIKIYNRTIYPVIQTYVIRNEESGFIVAEIFPIALVVEEKGEKYVISFTDDELNFEDLIEMVSSKKSPEKP